jgi:hypothetical protein
MTVDPGTEDLPNGIMVLAPAKVFQKWGHIFALPNDPAEYARHFYAILRELDGMKSAAIYIEMPPDLPEWAAVRDRITRATQPL